MLSQHVRSRELREARRESRATLRRVFPRLLLRRAVVLRGPGNLPGLNQAFRGIQHSHRRRVEGVLFLRHVRGRRQQVERPGGQQSPQRQDPQGGGRHPLLLPRPLHRGRGGRADKIRGELRPRGSPGWRQGEGNLDRFLQQDRPAGQLHAGLAPGERWEQGGSLVVVHRVRARRRRRHSGPLRRRLLDHGGATVDDDVHHRHADRHVLGAASQAGERPGDVIEQARDGRGAVLDRALDDLPRGVRRHRRLLQHAEGRLQGLPAEDISQGDVYGTKDNSVAQGIRGVHVRGVPGVYVAGRAGRVRREG